MLLECTEIDIGYRIVLVIFSQQNKIDCQRRVYCLLYYMLSTKDHGRHGPQRTATAIDNAQVSPISISFVKEYIKVACIENY